MSQVVVVYLGLGSNVGDRYHFLRKAIILLEEHPGIKVCKQSSIYETAPVGNVNQGPFLNMVIAIETQLGPFDILAFTQGIEHQLGRVREVKWGPRTIDIDLLLYGDTMVNTAQLKLPHPFLSERAFVLIPLLEIVENQSIAGMGTIERWLDCLDGKESVVKWMSSKSPIESGRFEN
jgi:2-amino-4-hydroxy-6-hydroxymethyldihydropteridine diphosphokinase